MASQSHGWARDFFGPLWVWLMIGVGLALMASAYYELHSMAMFVAGAVIIVAMLAYLGILFLRSVRAWLWGNHFDIKDLLMGREK